MEKLTNGALITLVGANGVAAGSSLTLVGTGYNNPHPWPGGAFALIN